MAKKAKKYRPKRRKAVSRSPRRRRRVGALALNASNPLIKYGSILAGYLFGDKILAPLKKLIPATIDGKIIGVAEGGIGYMLSLKKGGKKNLLTVVAGGILLGDGAKTVMQSFGIGGIGPYGRVNTINGPYGNVNVIGRRRIGNYSPNRSLNGYTPSGTLAKVVGSLGNASGSGILNSGSDMMS